MPLDLPLDLPLEKFERYGPVPKAPEGAAR